MLSSLLWEVNPRGKRRRHRKLSAKQIAAGFGGKRAKFHRNPRRKSRRKAHRKSAASAAPAPRRRRRGRRSVARRSRRSGVMRMGGGSVVQLLKGGAIGGAGAVLVDAAMGQAIKYLPASLATPMDATGNPQYGYFGVKAALALALGMYGRRLPVVGSYSGRMAEGSLTVLAYQFMRPMVAGFMPVGYFNPAPTFRPNMSGMRGEQRGQNQSGNYVGRVGAYVSGSSRRLSYMARVGNVRAYESTGAGARAANVVAMQNR